MSAANLLAACMVRWAAAQGYCEHEAAKESFPDPVHYWIATLRIASPGDLRALRRFINSVRP